MIWKIKWRKNNFSLSMRIYSFVRKVNIWTRKSQIQCNLQMIWTIRKILYSSSTFVYSYSPQSHESLHIIGQWKWCESMIQLMQKQNPPQSHGATYGLWFRVVPPGGILQGQGAAAAAGCITLRVPPSSIGTRGISEWRTSVINGR